MSEPTNPPTVLMVHLSGGIWVRKDHVDELHRQVSEAIPRLEVSAEYRIQGLVSSEFWASLSRADRRLAGRCLAHLVTSGKLALAFVSCPRCTNKVYRRL